MDIKVNEEGRFVIDPPKRPKKITGTRFGAVLDANRWQTPFQAWCEITKAWVKPYEETIYIKAGKVIEDKQLNWFSRLTPVIKPEEVYGKDFFNKTFGDFFSDDKIFGGMWDALVGTPDNVEGVIECKTTKRAEDWENDIPEYYALQAALYAYLLKLDDVYMIATFLDDEDYEHPEDFVCNSDNTTYVHFKVSERYPKFHEYITWCELWWKHHVETGVSPEYDEVKDKEYLDGLRTRVISGDDDIADLLDEAERLYRRIESVENSIKANKKRLSEIEGLLKKYAIEHETEGQNKAVFNSNGMTWTVSKSEKMSLDEKKLKEEGIYDKYLVPSVSYTIRKSINKGE